MTKVGLRTVTERNGLNQRVRLNPLTKEFEDLELRGINED